MIQKIKLKNVLGTMYLLILVFFVFSSIFYSLKITTLEGNVTLHSNESFIWKLSWEENRKYIVSIDVESEIPVDILLLDMNNIEKYNEGDVAFQFLTTASQFNTSLLSYDYTVPKTQEYYLVIENRNFTTGGAISLGEVTVNMQIKEITTPYTVLELVIHWVVFLCSGLILLYIIKGMEPFSPEIYTQDSGKISPTLFNNPQEYCFYPRRGDKRYHRVKSIAIAIMIFSAIILIFYSFSVLINERFYIDLPVPFVISLLLYILRIGLLVMFISWLILDYFFGRFLSWPFIMVGHLLFRQFKFRFFSDPLIFINPSKRQVRQGNEVIIEYVPDNAVVTIYKGFEEDSFVRVGWSGSQYSTYHYSIDWEVGIRYRINNIQHNIPLFLHSEHLGRFHDSSKPPLIDCQWIDIYALKIAELFDIPLVDISDGQSNTIQSEHLQTPLIHLLKETKLRKPPMDKDNQAKELKDFLGMLYDSSQIEIQKRGDRVDIITPRKWIFPRAWKERSAYSFGFIISIIYIVFVLASFGFPWFIQPLIESLSGLLFSIPQLIFGISNDYAWLLTTIIGTAICLFILLENLQNRTIISIYKDRISIRESILPFVKKEIRLENLKWLRQLTVWEKKSLELQTRDGRIILSGDFENTAELKYIILKVLSLQYQ
ncbi:MAG: hypothetical protein ACW97W_02510 [Candidatus Hodarchaeales archaeon]